ncbi:hypothetical protein MPTK1_2g13050 [Marchantia polymorpha subsp. ruderalis]|uniref:FAM192A/Fyv6 N-terminal domain-containing protein n=2 Tax=Marchantia polymorpha TaxID=3197 RepID=A0A176VEW0_MARPO|nr:hypothetical protein AXG93_2727s1020 [Marchantia polymorpha subsp. ruderalis]PTQ43189.1 hypothetical protein MARPO_0026s0067 [Marchantia polymorpha]BBN02130.1 hypothetical protein Mp_2g13050 [Marchantia polymorpha subsp. ruderalis]|eukprot:PTQ43189.1 hypothetical protein MARPO_0026s0067 [Marchantia polymorpha]
MVEPKLRLMNFVPESQGEEIPDSGGTRTGAGFDNRPLFEILKDNKEKKDAEFHERFKHRPPKALDDDETEFLENVEMMKREQERQQVEEEKLQLINFQTEILNRTISAEEPKTINAIQQELQEVPARNKRPLQARVLPVAVKIKPIPKRTKTEGFACKEINLEKFEVDQSPVQKENKNKDPSRKEDLSVNLLPGGLLGLVSYGESDDD